MLQLRDNFSFTGSDYPTLRSVPPEGTKIPFIANHSLLHMMKTQGQLAALIEASDHGSAFDQKAAERVAVKMFTHTLVLASHLGMSADDLISGVPAEM